MRLSDEILLVHGQNPLYDPVKAHEYYLRTRQLKGRQAGGKNESTPQRGKGSTYSLKGFHGENVKLSETQLTEQKAYASYRVSQIRKKLTELNGKLRKKLAAAREAEAKAKKGSTAAEKSKAAKEAKKYRDSHKQSLANKAKNNAAKKPTSPKPKKVDTVASLTKEIASTKQALKNEVARQRSLATAKKN